MEWTNDSGCSPSVLIIGYGNDLRSDDALGHYVATAIAEKAFPHVQTLTVHQLTPELAARLATVEMVIFIDAALVETTESQVQCCSLELSESQQIVSHSYDPRSLLTLTQALYLYTPKAWWVMVPGLNFELGTRLSPWAEQRVQDAVARVEQLIMAATKAHV